MPYVFQLIQALRQAGWKVKIHDFERLEPPHVTIYKKMRKWRLSLREGTFLDRGDNWSQINATLKATILDENNWLLFKQEWNRMHGDNPIEIEVEQADDDSGNSAHD